MVLGGTVGFGFAALESSGYALASLFVVQGNQLILSLNSVIFTELVRGVLAPFGHGMWSAILGGMIFAAARRGGLRVTWGVLGTYLLISALHGAFDSVTSIVGYVVVALVGLIPFIVLWRRGDAGGVLPRRRPSVA
jgi:RsiW-degrading membrane proteinase PrsW (M82 family)